MADKPSRALVVYGDGLIRGLESAAAPSPHLDSLASLSSCGFLSLPNATSSETNEERVVREFALLLDACDHTTGEVAPASTISERFMGMRMAVISSSPDIKSLCDKLSVAVFRLDELANNESSADEVTCELLKLLGFNEGEILEPPEFDIVFVHLDDVSAKDLSFSLKSFSNIIEHIMHKVPSGSSVGSRLHLSVLMSYGNVTDDDRLKYSIKTLHNEKNPFRSTICPLQSHLMRGETLRSDVRLYCPILMAQWQYAVTRKDLAGKYSFDEFKENGGTLVIPVDRFIHEVAFKLWKAPKYGA